MSKFIFDIDDVPEWKFEEAGRFLRKQKGREPEYEEVVEYLYAEAYDAYINWYESQMEEDDA